jgi:hypothetical protein
MITVPKSPPGVSQIAMAGGRVCDRSDLPPLHGRLRWL